MTHTGKISLSSGLARVVIFEQSVVQNLDRKGGMNVYQEKAKQACDLLDEFDLDLWLIFVRETAEHTDPVLKLFGHQRAVWPAAFLFGRGGERIAITGQGDDAPVRDLGLFDEVIPYTQSIREDLVRVLSRLDPKSIGLNYSRADVSADGLTYGMFLNLQEYLKDTPYAGRLVSADGFVGALRGCKTPQELGRMRQAIGLSMEIFEATTAWLRPGLSERQIYDFVQGQVRQRGLEFAWPVSGCPSLNAGPNSPWGHAGASDEKTSPGQTLNMDFGVKVDGFSSDNQRVWYFLREGETESPPGVTKVFDAVAGAIQAAADFVRPGVQGWEVDAVARKYIVEAGYAEYPHALGHSVGRHSHDGGIGFYPRWERYGDKPYGRIAKGGVFTLELGVRSEFGYIGIEEEILITADGCEWLAPPQKSLILIPA
jgi:Xaa-Pro aminopeptidase